MLSVYGVYHFWRPADGRPPLSSSSYHGFSGIMDTCLFGLFLAIGFMARYYYLQQPATEGRWRTVFHTTAETNEFLMITYLGFFALSCLHLVSFTMDVWLCWIYRKISQLPPDMNPLEDRPTSHATSSGSVSVEKLTAKTPGNRASGVSTLRQSYPTIRDSLASDNGGRPMSFFGSRADQDVGYSPHNPRTAHWSQTQLAEQDYKHSRSARNSHVDLTYHHDDLDFADSPNSRRVSALPSEPTMSKRNSAVNSPSFARDSFDDSRGKEMKPSREDLTTDNWFVLNASDAGSEASYDPYKYSSTTKAINSQPHTRRPGTLGDYETVSRSSPLHGESTFVPQPLSMHPPTPPPSAAMKVASPPLSNRDPRYYLPDAFTNDKENDRPVSPVQESSDRTATLTSAVSAISQSTDAGETVLSATTAASQTVVSAFGTAAFAALPSQQPRHHHQQLPPTAASRFFGTAAAGRGVQRVERAAADRPRSLVGSIHGGASDVGTVSSAGFGGGARGAARPARAARGWVPYSASRRNVSGGTTLESASGTVVRRDEGSKGRVVSRSGADVVDWRADVDSGAWKGRRRDVSGKVVEEGRGGSGRSGLFLRTISGNYQ